MRRDDEPIEVVGAGPAGLAAAITLARDGQNVVVHEARPHVGNRFEGDLQGLENWTTTTDVLGQLRDLDITTDFTKLASTTVTAFDAWDKTHRIRGRQPLFYLVERGPGESSIDSALLKQAQEEGGGRRAFRLPQDKNRRARRPCHWSESRRRHCGLLSLRNGYVRQNLDDPRQ